MISRSATDFVTLALRGLNVIDETRDPEPEMLAAGADVLNEMVDTWRTEKRLIYYVAPNQWPLVAGQPSYTIGIGGNFNQVWPNWIHRWSLVPNRAAAPVTALDRGRLLTEDEWAGIPVKSITGPYPTALFFDHQWNAGLGTIWTYPVPDNSNADVILWVPTPLAEFPDLTTKLTFPPGYHSALRYGLMEELGIDYPGTLTQDIKDRAKDVKAKVKRANFRLKEASFDAGLVGRPRRGRYNIYTDR